MSEQKRPYIEIEHFSFYYPERTEKVLDDLTLTVEQGEFLVLCGPSGCGKSTLLRQLKTVLAPHGRRLGSIRFEGRPLEELDQREQSAGIGFVQQDPENQIVTDKVWHELAFGLESLGYDTPTIRRRVAEMASFFGIQTWFYKNVTELSGGQKQLLNLASIMAMQPENWSLLHDWRCQRHQRPYGNLRQSDSNRYGHGHASYYRTRRLLVGYSAPA